MSNGVNVEGFVQLMEGLMQPDVNQIRASTQQLNQILVNPAYMMVLLQLVSSHQSVGIRQLAGILMRYRLGGNWSKLSEDQRQLICTTCLSLLQVETEKVVIKSIIGVVVLLSTILRDTWSGVVEFMKASYTHESVHVRATLFMLLDPVLESVGDVYADDFTDLMVIFKSGLEDPDVHVRLSALNALSSVFNWVEDMNHMAMVVEACPLMLQTIELGLKMGLEYETVKAFEVYKILVETGYEIPQNILGDLTLAMMQIVNCEHFQHDYRQTALDVLANIGRFAGNRLVEYGMMPAVMECICRYGCSDDSANYDQGGLVRDDGNYEAPSSGTTRAIDLISMSLIGDKLYQLIAPELEKMTSRGTFGVVTNYLTICVIASYCGENFNAPEVSPMLFQHYVNGLNDERVIVSEAAAVSLGTAIGDLDSFYVDSPAFVDVILTRLQSSLSLQVYSEKLLFALEQVVVHGNHMQMNIAGVGEAMSSIVMNESFAQGIREGAFLVMSALLDVSMDRMRPMLPSLLPVICPILTYTDDKTINLRRAVTEVVGLIATELPSLIQASGNHNLSMEWFVEQILKGVHDLGYDDLTEYSLGTLMLMAEAMGEGYVKYVDVTIDEALAGIRKAISFTEHMEGTPGGLEVDDDAKQLVAGFSDNFFNMKVAALHCIGFFTYDAGYAILSRMDEIRPEVVELVHWSHPTLRSKAGVTCLQLAGCYIQYDSDSERAYTQAAELINEAFKLAIADEEYLVTVEVCGNIVTPISPVLKRQDGASMCDRMMKTIILPFLTSILEGKYYYKSQPQPGLDDEALESHINKVLDSVCDSLADIAGLMGPDFKPYYDLMVPVLTNNIQQASHNELVFYFGLYAEMALHLKEAYRPYAIDTAELVKAAMPIGHDGVRRNAIFCFGILCASHAEVLTGFYPVMLPICKALGLSAQGALRDNAVSCVVRMCEGDAQRCTRKETLQLLSKTLPLQEDMEENKVVYGFAFDAFTEKDPEALGLGVEFYQCFIRAMKQEALEDEIKEGCAILAKALRDVFPADVIQLAEANA